jgi:hypothetical protein
MTRALKKLIDHKNAAQLAINVLFDLSKKHCAISFLIQILPTNTLKNANRG